MENHVSRMIGDTGRWLLGLSPLLLAVAFYASFRFFDAKLGLDVAMWKNASHREVQTATELKAAQNAVERILNRIEPRRDVAATNAAAEKELTAARAALTEARAASDQPRPSPVAHELSLRLCWGVVGSIFTFLIVLVGIQSIREIDDIATRSAPHRQNARRPKRVLCLAAIAFLAVALWGALTWCDRTELGSSMAGLSATRLFESLQGQNNILGPRNEPLPAKIEELGLLIAFMNHGAMLAILLVSSAVSSVVWHTHAKLRDLMTLKQSKADLDETARWLEVTGGRAVTLMQLTAAALIVGVVEVLLLYLLTSHHVRAALQPDARLFAQIVAFTGGLVYSGVLVAIYLPLYDALKSFRAELAVRMKSVAPPIPPRPEIGKRDSTPANDPVPDIFAIPLVKSALTLFSPVLAAIATALVGALQDVLPR